MRYLAKSWSNIFSVGNYGFFLTFCLYLTGISYLAHADPGTTKESTVEVVNQLGYRGIYVYVISGQSDRRGYANPSGKNFQKVQGKTSNFRRSGFMSLSVEPQNGFHLNQDESAWWEAKYTSDHPINLYSVALHELGHVLGLAPRYPVFSDWYHKRYIDDFEVERYFGRFPHLNEECHLVFQHNTPPPPAGRASELWKWEKKERLNSISWFEEHLTSIIKKTETELKSWSEKQIQLASNISSNPSRLSTERIIEEQISASKEDISSLKFQLEKEFNRRVQSIKHLESGYGAQTWSLEENKLRSQFETAVANLYKGCSKALEKSASAISILNSENPANEPSVKIISSENNPSEKTEADSGYIKIVFPVKNTPPLLTLKDRFGRDISRRGIELRDWEGQIANPSPIFSLSLSDQIVLPATATLCSTEPRLYFDLPSEIGSSGPSKTLVFDNNLRDFPFKFAIWPDRDGTDELHSLKVQVKDAQENTHQLEVPIKVSDLDGVQTEVEINTILPRNALPFLENHLLNPYTSHNESAFFINEPEPLPNPYPFAIHLDFVKDISQTFSSPEIRQAIRLAAHDLSYFFEEQQFVEISPQSETTDLIFKTGSYNHKGQKQPDQPEIDPASSKGAFGATSGNMPHRKWILTKLDILLFRALGYKMKNTSMFEPLSFKPQEITPGVSGIPYQFPLKAQGGLPPYYFSLAAGSFPEGLSLDSFSGELSGTPKENGVFIFLIKVEDNQPENTIPPIAAFTLTIQAK